MPLSELPDEVLDAVMPLDRRLNIGNFAVEPKFRSWLAKRRQLVLDTIEPGNMANKTMHALAMCTGLQKLDVTSCMFPLTDKEISGIVRSIPTSVREINFESNPRIKRVELRYFQRLTALETLCLHHTQTTNEWMVSLLPCIPRVKKLMIGTNPITEGITRGNIFDDWQLPVNLEYLDVSNTEINRKHIGSLFGALSTCNSLKKLLISFNDLHNTVRLDHTLPTSLVELQMAMCSLETEEFILLLNRLPSTLQILDLSNNQISMSGGDFVMLPPHLQELNMQHNRLTTFGVQILCHLLEGRTSFTSLDLSYQNMPGIPSWSTAQGNVFRLLPATLQRLHMISLNLTGADVRALAHLTRLDTLVLQRNKMIEDDGIRTLSKFHHLTTLNVCECGISDYGFLSSIAPMLTRLHTLNIGGNAGIRRASAEAIAKSSTTSLTRLTIVQSSMTHDDFKIIAKLPSLKRFTRS